MRQVRKRREVKRAGMFLKYDFVAIGLGQHSFDRVIGELGIKPNAYGLYSETQARAILSHYHATKDPHLNHRKFR